MKKWTDRTKLSTGIAIAVLFATGLFATPASGDATKPVEVTNFPSVQAVSITGTPVPVSITGIGTTTISGSVKTQDVDNAARHPFQISLGGTEFSSFEVPADQRLTIETISGSCTSTGDARPFFPTSIATTVGGKGVTYNLLAMFLATGTGSAAGINFYFAGATMVRMYADPGTTVFAFTGTGGSHCGVSISGYMIPQ